MDDFKLVREINKEWGDYFLCNHCGERVEKGTVTISHHWIHCLKRTGGLIIAKNDMQRKLLDSWSMNADNYQTK